MNYTLLGAGLMGGACARFLLKWDDTTSLTIIERDEKTLGRLLNKLSDRRVMGSQKNIETPDSLARTIKDTDVCISTLPYSLNPLITKASIRAVVNMCDMGGNHSVVNEQLSLNEEAVEAGITVVPDTGLSPGLGNSIVARAVSLLDKTDEVRLRCGGLPTNPTPPFNYQLTFSVDGLINEYVEECKVLRDGKVNWVAPLSGIEEKDFVGEFGVLEAFHTSGGSSTLPDTYEGEIDSLDYKTLRYPGHCELMRGLKYLGLGDDERRDFGGGFHASPRYILGEILIDALSGEGEDVVIMDCETRGELKDKPTRVIHRLIINAKPDEGLTAMMIGTSLPTAITARFLADGKVEKAGVLTPELALPTDEFLNAFQEESGVEIEESVEAIED